MRHRFLLCLCIVYLFPTLAAAQDPLSAESETQADRWLAHLKKCTSSTFSLTGKFVQEIQCVSPEETRRFSGTFEVKRKTKYRWMYSDPKGKLMVSDGTHSYLYDKETKTVFADHPSDSLLSGVAQILSGAVEGDFFIEYMGGANRPEDGLGVIRLTPAAAHPFVKSLLVTISAKAPCIRRIVIVDASGCIIRTTFEEVRRNTGVKERRFCFTPPKNAIILTP